MPSPSRRSTTILVFTAGAVTLYCYCRRRQQQQQQQQQQPSSSSSSSSPPPSSFAVPRDVHDRVVFAAWKRRGWGDEEAQAATDICSEAALCGVGSHNFIKALDIDDKLGAGLEGDARGCIPGRRWSVCPSPFKACQRWDAQKCSGFLVARAAVDAAMALADEHGTGVVMVDNAFHYLWGAAYVLRASRRGYICFTTCTGAIPEVVPFGGKVGTMGTNPWTWALPTAATDIGFDFVCDFATSVMSNGTVKALARAGRRVPGGAIVDPSGEPTDDPHRLGAHRCFGGHKGYALCVLTELLAAFGGGSLPSLRCAGGFTPGFRRTEQQQQQQQGRTQTPIPPIPPLEKTSCNFYFQVIRPDAIAGADYAAGRSQGQNVAAVAADVLGWGNSPPPSPASAAAAAAAACAAAAPRHSSPGTARLPGWGKHAAMERSRALGGALVFSAVEVSALRRLAAECGVPLPNEEFPRVVL